MSGEQDDVLFDKLRPYWWLFLYSQYLPLWAWKLPIFYFWYSSVVAADIFWYDPLLGFLILQMHSAKFLRFLLHNCYAGLHLNERFNLIMKHYSPRVVSLFTLFWCCLFSQKRRQMFLNFVIWVLMSLLIAYDVLGCEKAATLTETKKVLLKSHLKRISLNWKSWACCLPCLLKQQSVIYVFLELKLADDE